MQTGIVELSVLSYFRSNDQLSHQAFWVYYFAITYPPDK